MEKKVGLKESFLRWEKSQHVFTLIGKIPVEKNVNALKEMGRMVGATSQREWKAAGWTAHTEGQAVSGDQRQGRECGHRSGRRGRGSWSLLIAVVFSTNEEAMLRESTSEKLLET